MLSTSRGHDHRILVHVAEQGDLGLDLLGQELLRATEKNLGLDTDLPEGLDAVLGRLGLQFPGGAKIRNQGEMDITDVLASQVAAQLADRLQERLPLDIPRRAPDLYDGNICHALQPEDSLLDLVRDVRNHLDRLPQIISPALLLDDRFINLAGGEVVYLAQGGLGEPLIMA